MTLDHTANETLKTLILTPIKPFEQLKVGDPSYLEEIAEAEAEGREVKNLKKLTADTKIRRVTNGMMAISEIEGEKYGVKLRTIGLDVALSGANNIKECVEDFGIYLTDRYYDGCLKETHRLGCDTAAFEMTIDGRTEEIETGADGYYGMFLKMKQGKGAYLSLTFDGELFSVEDVQQYADYWFEKADINYGKFLPMLDKAIRDVLAS